MVHPYSGVNPDKYYTFCDEITKCKNELHTRPQISKQHFYVAMKSLHDMEVEEPELTPIIKSIGKDIEEMLIYEHKRVGLYIFPRY